MICTKSRCTTGIHTGYQVIRRAPGFSFQIVNIRVPGMGLAPSHRIKTNPDGWGADRPRGLCEWQIILTLAGEGCFSHDEHTFRPKAGVAVLQPAGMPQRYGLGDVSAYWEQIWVGFVPRQEILPLLRWPQEIPGVLAFDFGKGKRFQALRRTLLNIHFICHSCKTFRDLRASHQFEGFLLDCLDLMDIKESSPAPRDERVGAALQWIDQEFHRNIKFAHLAGHCGVSLSRIEHLVKEETGLPIRVHRENARLRRARYLLEFTKQTVSEIAYSVGFRSPKQFCTRFKAAENMSPGAFRKRHYNNTLPGPPS